MKKLIHCKKLMQKNDFENIRSKLKKIVIDYSPSSGIIDHTFIKSNLNCSLKL